jgi:malonate decarboxylase delta subunit
VLVGVLASGNLEILLEPAALDGAMTVRIITAAKGFGSVWQAVISDFAQRHPLRDVRISINDAGATPAVVSLRLDQAVETLLLEIHDEPDAALQLLRSRCARAHRRPGRCRFVHEFLGPARRMMSPHLAQLDQPAAFDDGIVVGEATLRATRAAGRAAG